MYSTGMDRRRLSQLQSGHGVVYLICSHCEHFGVKDLVALAAKCGGWDAMAGDVARRLKCQKCGTRNPTLSAVRPPVTRKDVCPKCLNPLSDPSPKLTDPFKDKRCNRCLRPLIRQPR